VSTRGEPDTVPRLARPFVALLIGALLASAIFAWEPWPLTSFRLFSHVRSDSQTSWRATLVDAAGAEAPYALGSSARGFRNFGFRMAEFAATGQGRRAELCRAWIDAAPDVARRRAVEVRLYRRSWLLSEREHDRAAPGGEERVYDCTRAGARVAG